MCFDSIFSLPEPEIHKGSLLYRVDPASVCMCVRALILLNMNIFGTNRQILIKFYQKHHWVGGKASIGFGALRFRTLVSMRTENSKRVVFHQIIFILAGDEDMH